MNPRLRGAGRIALGVCLISILTACASNETLRKDFQRDRNACVGQRFGDPDWWWCGWDEPTRIVSLDRDHDEYQITSTQMPGCRWAYIVDRGLGLVRAWRYVSDRKPCYLPVDWLGAW